jgi:phenylalanyl-tRNA synthetase beta subunit
MPLSRFPSTSQDISLKTGVDVSYGDLYANVRASLDEQANGIAIDMTPVSIYQATEDTATKTTTFHIVFTSYDRTLTDDDVKPHMDHVAARAHSLLNAERI